MITTFNIEQTYDALEYDGRALTFDERTGRTTLTDGAAGYRWVGRCKHCKRGNKLEGRIVYARRGARADMLIDAFGVYYLTGCFGTDHSHVRVKCSSNCGGWVQLTRVREGTKHSKHECNAKCLAATGPSCDCKCKGMNHGSNH